MNKRFTLLLLIFSILIYGANATEYLPILKGEGKPPKNVCIAEFEKKGKNLITRY